LHAARRPLARRRGRPRAGNVAGRDRRPAPPEDPQLLVAARDEPICVCEFTAALDLAQPNVSYHLRQLVDAGIIERERRGRYSFYALVDGALSNIASLLAAPNRRAAAA
jgi:ArsR family transcriptional regulator